MSETKMDNKPLPPISGNPDSPLMGDIAGLPLPPTDPLSAMPMESHSQPDRGKSTLREMFFGPDGIHALPRVLIYLAMAWLIFQVEGWLLLSLRTRPNALWWRMFIEASMALAAVLPGFVMARIEQRPFGAFGLPIRRAFGRNFWIGTIWGIASLSFLMLTLRATGSFHFGSFALHGSRIWKFAAFYALLFLLTGFFEEFLFRGYSQWILTRGFNFWPAALFLSTAFGYIHGANPGEAKTGLIAAGFIGFFLCLTLRRTGNLWWAIGFHSAWDWGESFLYSVPDSGAVLPGHLLNSTLHGPLWLTGGSVGPEGSYLVFALIGALWALFDRAYPKVKYDAK
jgi:hypothetical protein